MIGDRRVRWIAMAFLIPLVLWWYWARILDDVRGDPLEADMAEQEYSQALFSKSQPLPYGREDATEIIETFYETFTYFGDSETSRSHEQHFRTYCVWYEEFIRTVTYDRAAEWSCVANPGEPVGQLLVRYDFNDSLKFPDYPSAMDFIDVLEESDFILLHSISVAPAAYKEPTSDDEENDAQDQDIALEDIALEDIPLDDIPALIVDEVLDDEEGPTGVQVGYQADLYALAELPDQADLLASLS